jgi:plasmid maintenance system antidote protein VapI
MAIRLEQAFGVAAGFWLDLQKNMTSGKCRKMAKFMSTESGLK